MSTTYTVENMRVVIPKGKTAERNPDRFATVYGEFYDPKGNPLSVTQKVITNDMAQNAETVIDVTNGILTLPSGERGRKPSVSITQEDITSLLDSLRNGDAS